MCSFVINLIKITKNLTIANKKMQARIMSQSKPVIAGFILVQLSQLAKALKCPTFPHSHFCTAD